MSHNQPASGLFRHLAKRRDKRCWIERRHAVEERQTSGSFYSVLVVIIANTLLLSKLARRLSAGTATGNYFLHSTGCLLYTGHGGTAITNRSSVDSAKVPIVARKDCRANPTTNDTTVLVANHIREMLSTLFWPIKSILPSKMSCSGAMLVCTQLIALATAKGPGGD